MKVLHVISTLGLGGIERWLATLLEDLPRDRYELDFCCKTSPTGALRPQVEAHGSRIWFCRLRPDHVRFMRCLAKTLESGRYDVVHNHLETYSGVVVAVARKVGIPVITSYHLTNFVPFGRLGFFGLRQLRSLYGNLSVDYAIKHSHQVTGCSRAVLDRIDTRWVEDPRFRVIYYGTPIPDIDRQEARSALRTEMGWEADTPVAIHVGHFKPQKNHRFLLVAFKEVLEAEPAARLVLVGDGPLLSKMREQARALGMSEATRFLGARADTSRLIAGADVFMFPSLFEGFGLAALEASAVQTPVVASRVAGVTEAVDDGRTGILVESGNKQEMASAVIRLLRDPSLCDSLGRQGSEWVRTRFTPQESARQVMDLYEETLAR